jgi:hypothetical protein
MHKELKGVEFGSKGEGLPKASIVSFPENLVGIHYRMPSQSE